MSLFFPRKKRYFDTQIAVMENHLANANESSMHGGKNAMEKLASHIHKVENGLKSKKRLKIYLKLIFILTLPGTIISTKDHYHAMD